VLWQDHAAQTCFKEYSTVGGKQDNTTAKVGGTYLFHCKSRWRS